MALEDYYIAYQQTARVPGEFLLRIHVPARASTTHLRAYKVSRRHDQDISSVFVAFRLDLDGTRIVQARFGCGGVAATPRRAAATERLLAGRDWSEATARAAGAALASEFAPISDLRASAVYRRQLLARLLWRCWLETGPGRSDASPLRVQDVAT
jgi:xanthine dehydrogenase small subunit